MCLCVCLYMPQHIWRHQRTTSWSWFYHSTFTWVVVSKLQTRDMHGKCLYLLSHRSDPKALSISASCKSLTHKYLANIRLARNMALMKMKLPFHTSYALMISVGQRVAISFHEGKESRACGYGLSWSSISTVRTTSLERTRPILMDRTLWILKFVKRDLWELEKGMALEYICFGAAGLEERNVRWLSCKAFIDIRQPVQRVCAPHH